MTFFQNPMEVIGKLMDQAALVQKAAKTFSAAVEDPVHAPFYAKALEEIEHTADGIVHDIDGRLLRIFIIPDIDKEDIRALTELLDNVIDFIEEAANRIVLFNLPMGTQELRDFAKLLVRAAEEIQRGVAFLHERNAQSAAYVNCYKSIHTIENLGDVLHRSTLPLINDLRVDLREVFKWMRVYQTLEDALDACEDVAIAFERIRTKLT